MLSREGLCTCDNGANALHAGRVFNAHANIRRNVAPNGRHACALPNATALRAGEQAAVSLTRVPLLKTRSHAHASIVRSAVLQLGCPVVESLHNTSPRGAARPSLAVQA